MKSAVNKLRADFDSEIFVASDVLTTYQRPESVSRKSNPEVQLVNETQFVVQGCGQHAACDKKLVPSKSVLLLRTYHTRQRKKVKEKAT